MKSGSTSSNHLAPSVTTSAALHSDAILNPSRDVTSQLPKNGLVRSTDRFSSPHLATKDSFHGDLIRIIIE